MTFNDNKQVKQSGRGKERERERGGGGGREREKRRQKLKKNVFHEKCFLKSCCPK